jgi:uncharacterized membrane protein
LWLVLIKIPNSEQEIRHTKKYNTMKRYLIITAVCLLAGLASRAQVPYQKVGNNPTTINSNAALKIESTNKGFLPTRMTVAQRNAITSPADGLVVY